MFKEAGQAVDAIVAQIGASDDWPNYWVPFSYLHMLSGLVYLRLGDSQSAMYTLSNAMTRSSPAKMRIQRCAESIIASLMQQPKSDAGVGDSAGEPGLESETPADENPAGTGI
jgi:hypothetical protein